MKHLLCHALLLTVVLVFPATTPAQQDRGLVTENITIKSTILNEEMRVSVYLPPGAFPTAPFSKVNVQEENRVHLPNSAERRFPVLYLLHGYTGDHTCWIQFGEVARIADAAIRSGKATPMIIVMPDAKNTFYMNRHDGSYQYEDYFFKELIPYIEKYFPVRAKKEFRAVAGLSMGGYGSLLYALKYPEMFASSCPISAAVRFDEEINAMPYSRYKERFSELYGAIKEGENRVTDFWKANSIEHLTIRFAGERDKLETAMKAKDVSAEEKKRLQETLRAKNIRFYIDCGDDDGLSPGNAKLHLLMREKKIAHEYRMRDGGHTWTYWRDSLPMVLEFVSAGFHR